MDLNKSLSTDQKKQDPFSQPNSAKFGLDEIDEDIDSFFMQNKGTKSDLDLDSLYKQNEEKIKLNPSGNDLEGGDKSQEDNTNSRWFKVSQYASVEYFRDLFNINTDDVLARLKYSVFPFKAGGLFGEKEYDLYGPIWIVFTLVFTTSIFGSAFIGAESMDKERATNMSLHQIGKSFTLLTLYLLVNSLVLFYYFTKEGARSVRYFEIMSIFGYSFTILPIVEVLLLIPIFWSKLIFLALGAFISTFLVRKELKELNKKYLPRKEVKYIRTYGVVSHAVWLVLMKLLFL